MRPDRPNSSAPTACLPASRCARASVRAAQGRKVEALQDIDAALAIFLAMGKGGEVYLPAVNTLRDTLLAP